MSVWDWADLRELAAPEHRVTLGEGNTPLVRSLRLGPEVGLENLWYKLDYATPTGSYKDRFAAGAISTMRARGQRRCIATSSGNTGAALAAYCAAAGMACEIAIVEGAPDGKLRQMQAYGARIYRVKGFGLDPEVSRATFAFLQKRAAAPDAALQISAFHYSPEGMTCVQSLSYELARQFPELPDHVFCQSGGGGLTLAVARGFQHLAAIGDPRPMPRIECVQPAGNDTIVTPLRNGLDRARSVPCTSRISGLQVPDVIDGHETLAACRASGGTGHVVEDDLVWEIQSRLAREEGLFCEPAAATAVAGALQAARRGEIDPSARVVCLLTGIGFKDPPSLERMAGPSCPIYTLEELDHALG